MYLDRRKKALIILLVVLLFFLCQKLIIGEMLPYYINLKSRLEDEKAKLSSIRETAEKLPKLKKEVQTAEAELTSLIQRLGITFDDEDSFLLALYPPQSGVKVKLFQPLEEETKGSFSLMPFRITVLGNYPEVLNYLLYLETLPALTEIRELRIISAREEAGQVEASFTIALYKVGLTKDKSINVDNEKNKETDLPAERGRNIFEPVNKKDT